MTGPEAIGHPGGHGTAVVAEPELGVHGGQVSGRVGDEALVADEAGPVRADRPVGHGDGTDRGQRPADDGPERR